MKKIVYLSILLVFLIPFYNAFADDTDLYILTQLMQQVPPDALILVDLSGSMVWTPDGSSSYTLYIDPGTCTHYDYHGNCTSWTHNCGDNNIAYYTTNGSPHTASCSINSTTTIWGDPTCAGPYYYTYNYTGGSGSQTNCTKSKLAIAKQAIFKFLDVDNGSGTGTPDGIINSNDQNYLKIRMGYMRYYDCSSSETVNSTSYNSGCNTLIDPLNTSYSTIYCHGTSCTPLSSGSSISVAYENASGGTPLAAALQEAKYYFDYSKTNDVDAACRQKFVILITDGDDTYACGMTGSEGSTKQYKGRREMVAQARALANAGYYVFVIGFGSNMPSYLQNTLNWAAYYGNTRNTDTTQSISQTYSIPYGQIYPSGITQCVDSQYTNGGSFGSYGTYYYANTNDPGRFGISGYAFIAQNATQLNDAIMNIRNFIITLIAQSTSYVAPVVPVSQYQSTSSENSMYLGMFKPTTKTMWKGNIKKYGIATTETQTLSVGDIIDANNQPVMTSQYAIKGTAQSYWSSSADGGDVEKGGVGAVLLGSNLDSRNIYTYLGTNTDLSNSSNAFSKSNAAITPTLLGLSPTDTTGGNNIIDFIHGWDVWNWSNGPGHPRDWILGAFIHSRPLVIHYGSQDVIYAGANDGMLHAFDNNNGNELWGFIPPDLLPNLKNFNNSLASLQVFVDGSPKTYVTYAYNADGSIQSVTQAILIFGERRGGNNYIALDVTDFSHPKFLWSISPSQIRYGTTTTSTTAYRELGQSWSTPILGMIKNGTGTKWVAFIGGGYDNTYVNSVPAPAEDKTPPGTDTSGRAIYVVDVTNGSQIWKYSYADNPAMQYSIPSDIATVDTNGDGLIDRLYVGDMKGQIWRFDIGDMSNTGSWSGKIIFNASGKIFYPPDVTLEKDSSGNYEMLFFGMGDREKPNDTSFVNTLYALKDKNPASPYTESNDLVDVTQDLLQDPNTSNSDKVNLLNQLKQKNGWYIRLSQNSGEKCDATAVVLAGDTYFTTFTPTPASGTCTLGSGQGRTYMLKYMTGNAAFNLDASNDLEGKSVIGSTDRSVATGLGIPSGIIICIIGDNVIGYGGVAGGVFSPQLPVIRSIVPINWRTVF